VLELGIRPRVVRETREVRLDARAQDRTEIAQRRSF